MAIHHLTPPVRGGERPRLPSAQRGPVSVALAAMHAADPDRERIRDLRRRIYPSGSRPTSPCSTRSTATSVGRCTHDDRGSLTPVDGRRHSGVRRWASVLAHLGQSDSACEPGEIHVIAGAMVSLGQALRARLEGYSQSDARRSMSASTVRGFLRSLVSLPLIGGGVTLIGAPSALPSPSPRASFANTTTGSCTSGERSFARSRLEAAHSSAGCCVW